MLTYIPHWLLLDSFTPNQCSKIKEPIVNMDNRFNKVFSSFDFFNKEFAPGSQLIDIFFVSFLFTYLPSFNKAIITSKLIFVFWTIFFSNPLQIFCMLLLYPMPVSRTMLLPLSCIFTFIICQLSEVQDSGL